MEVKCNTRREELEMMRSKRLKREEVIRVGPKESKNSNRLHLRNIMGQMMNKRSRMILSTVMTCLYHITAIDQGIQWNSLLVQATSHVVGTSSRGAHQTGHSSGKVVIIREEAITTEEDNVYSDF